MATANEQTEQSAKVPATHYVTAETLERFNRLVPLNTRSETVELLMKRMIAEAEGGLVRAALAMQADPSYDEVHADMEALTAETFERLDRNGKR